MTGGENYEFRKQYMNIQVMRAVETWQQAGAYYVRIQAMSRQYHITLREEFDDHDTPDAKYIVLLDNDFPVRNLPVI